MSQRQDLSREIEQKGAIIGKLRDEIGKVMVGQRYLIDRLILALLADGHVLVEGLPGLAKTTAIKALADCVRADFGCSSPLICCRPTSSAPRSTGPSRASS